MFLLFSFVLIGFSKWRKQFRWGRERENFHQDFLERFSQDLALFAKAQQAKASRRTDVIVNMIFTHTLCVTILLFMLPRIMNLEYF